MWEAIGGVVAGVVLGLAVFGWSVAPIDAERNAKEWMQSRGIYPSFVACPRRSEKAYVLCTMYVPTPEGSETIQVFDCKTGRSRDDAKACREPFQAEQEQPQ